MPLLPRRLYARIALIGALAVASAMAIFGVYITHELMEFAEEANAREALSLADALASGIAESVAGGDYARVERDFLQAGANRDAVLSLALVEDSGRVRVSLRRQRDGTPLSRGSEGILAVPAQIGHVTTVLADRTVAWHPLEAPGVTGWVRAELSMADDVAVRAHVWRDTLIMMLLAILASAALFLFFLRRPLLEIRRAAAFAASLDHNRGSQLPVTTSVREVEVLVNSLNLASTNLRLQEAALQKEKAVLEARNHTSLLLASGGSLKEILTLIIEAAQLERPELLGSILLLDATGKLLCHGVAPDLPAAYRQAIEGVSIGDNVASWGTAAFRDERVVVADIASHADWRDFRAAAQQAGLAACWSEPIRAYRGAVIGVFSLYRRVAGAPTVDDLEALAHGAYFASIAIERAQVEEELQLASSVYQASGEAMFVTDENDRILAVNPAFTRLTGYEAQEVIGANPRLLGSDRNDKTVFIAMWRALQATGQWQGEIWNRRKCGEEFAEWLTVTTIRNEEGQVHRRIALFSDITEKKQADEIIWQQANYDVLTGLPNRRLFRDRLKQELRRAQRTDKDVALLFIDLDHFKEVNDTLGHSAGDQLLIEAARRIVGCVREADTVARLGGDEFTVTLPGLGDPGAIERIAQAIMQTLAEPFILRNERAYASASIGLTLFPADAADMEELLRNADQAMYAAKEAGRNGYSWFTAAMQQAAKVRRGLVRDLRGALAANQFEVYYQPIVELATGRIVKAEALLRWHHPELGMISPGVFIPLAEEVGLIREIGDWVFRESVLRARGWLTRWQVPIQISVNKSPRQFVMNADDEAWLAHMREIGLPAEMLIVEITEGLLLDERPEVAAKLRRFRAAGVQVAIDDFGTGYSALSYLQKFAIDYVKIDRSFIQDLTTDSNDRALAEAIVVMAHRLGLKVVAEGVETEQQRDYLAAVDCDYIQGFLYARPMPAADFERLLAEHLG